MPLNVAVLLVRFSSFLMSSLRLMSFPMFSGSFGGVCFICGHMRRPPIGGSASSNVMFGMVSPSTTALAVFLPFT